MAAGVFLWSVNAGIAMSRVRLLPVWWALPVFSVLRAFPTKLGSVVAALAAVFCLFMLPWIVLADARNRLFRPVALLAGAVFLLAIFLLGASGAHDLDEAAFPGAPGPFVLDANLNTQLWLSRGAMAYYFAYIVLIAPALGWRRKPDAAAVFT